MTPLKQNNLCNQFGLSTRQYRDNRDRYKDEYEECIGEEWFIEICNDETNTKWQMNIEALERFMNQLKLMGVNGVVEWGDMEPINKNIDKIVKAIRKVSPECIEDIDDWLTLRVFEWYISLTPDDKAKYGLEV
jgi:hypothetical protein